MTAPTILWPARERAEPLSGASVHVWAASLDLPDERVARLATTLSDDERDRAARFRGRHLTTRYIAARGHLRQLLGSYVGVHPADVRFAYDANGKPRLATPAAHPALQFNVSHSGGLALYAVSLAPQVGVDVEVVNAFADMADVAKQFFSPAERQRLRAESPATFASAFYRCWTRKEAYLKATGDGLLRPLDSFDVSLGSGEDAALLRVDGDDDAHRRWALVHLEPAQGCLGALAVETPHPDVRSWLWP